MTRHCLTVGLCLCLTAACARDETVAAYGAADKTWKLVALNDQPFTASATLVFAQDGTISGAAPCNSYRADMTAPYPWFDIGPVASTRRLCDDSAAETTFFTALSQMTLSEVLGNALILSTPDGGSMLFKADA